MEYGCVFSFVGRRSTTAETTAAAAAAHLGVTTYMLFLGVSTYMLFLILVFVTFLWVLYHIPPPC